jgi:polar amino acid transport system substrate-binding protein
MLAAGGVGISGRACGCYLHRTDKNRKPRLLRGVEGEGSMLRVGYLAVLALLIGAPPLAADEAAKKELAPTGKLRVGIAIGPTIGAGNVVMEEGKPRGIAVDLGAEMAQKLGVPVDYVPYPNSGALTDAVASGAWDVAFIPVDDQRKQKVDFGAAHIVLQSTYLVGPNSPIQSLADVDKPGVRVAGVEGTATARASAASLKNTQITLVKTAQELFELLRSGQADAIAQSRESLTGMSGRLPGSRVLDGAYLSSFVAVAVPKNKPAALAYASAFVEEAKASGSVRRALDKGGLKTSTVAPAGVKP